MHENLEVRMSLKPESRTVAGYVALYDVPTIFAGKEETIKPGAFTKALEEAKTGSLDRRIFALYKHDTKQVLAHTGNNSLRLQDGVRGLWAEIDIPDDREDVYNRVVTGLADGASFGFASHGSIISEMPGSRMLKELKLREVTILEAPAYLATTRSSYYDAPNEVHEAQIPAELRAMLLETIENKEGE